MTPSSPARRLNHCKRPFFIRNNAVPPAVSFVLAQPQQTRSLTSAVDKLPSILRRAMPPPDPSQSNAPVTTENCDPSPIDDDFIESPPVNAVQDSNRPALVRESLTPPVSTSDHAPVIPPVDQLPHPAPPPCTTPPVLQVPTPSPSNRAWFSVFPWPTVKNPSVSEAGVRSGSDAVQASSERCDHGLHATITARPAGAADTCPRLDRVSLPGASALQSPHPAPPSNFNDADHSSIHEEQPVSQARSSPFPHDSQAAGNISPIAPNSTASAFVFNFSMLTKARPPPEAPVKSSAEPSCGPSVATPDPESDSMNVVKPTRTASASAVHVSDCGDQSPTQPATSTEAHTNTWWTYLGWNGNTPAVKTEPSAQNSQPLGAHASSAPPDQPLIPDPTESSQLDGEVAPQVDLNTDHVEYLISGDMERHSAQTADPATAPHNSPWYAPWSWYQSSSAAAAAPDISSGPQEDPPDHSQTDVQAEEKSPAGGLSPPDQASPSPQHLTAAGPVDYGNPIQAVISANPTGWMSFFTAKAIAMKSITYEKEVGKMEVMEIDDEMVPGPNSASPSAPAVIQPSPTGAPKPPLPPQPQNTSDIPLFSSPPLTKLDDERPPIPQAAINIESVTNDSLKRQPSPSPSKKSRVKTPTSPPRPNLVLPTWNDTFSVLPRSVAPREPPSALSRTLQYVSGVLFSRDEAPSNKGKGKAKEYIYSPYDRALPRTWDVVTEGQGADVLRGCQRVVIIGVHGWFPGTVLRTFAGEPTGTSSKFVNGIADALDCFLEEHKAMLEKVTKIPLEGEGTIARRVERLYQDLIGNKEWMDDLHDAGAIFIATHSQGSVVSTHLLDRLIADGHIRTNLNTDASIPASGLASGSVAMVKPPQRICCLALCGIHLGPLRYLSTSSLVQPYIQYFESTAARELFEFQNTDSVISRDYVKALRNVLDNGIKMVYIASLNDQVVGLYSGLFTSVSHPLILRALYIDGDAYHPSDFLSNLLVLLMRIRNAGLSDSGLLTHLSEVTAGSLNGIGHSTPYEERATYSLAVNYLFLTDGGSGAQVGLVEEPFSALAERNDYEIPWALRDLIADEKVATLFSDEIVALRDAFRDWHPKTSILRDVKRKLQPIQRLSSALITSHTSKL